MRYLSKTEPLSQKYTSEWASEHVATRGVDSTLPLNISGTQAVKTGKPLQPLITYNE